MNNQNFGNPLEGEGVGTLDALEARERRELKRVECPECLRRLESVGDYRDAHKHYEKIGTLIGEERGHAKFYGMGYPIPLCEAEKK